MKDLLDQINGVVWGPITLWLIGLTGLYLLVGLRFMPLRRIGFAVRQTLLSIRHSGGTNGFGVIPLGLLAGGVGW